MFQAIGPEDGTLRRAPLITFVFIGLQILGFLVHLILPDNLDPLKSVIYYQMERPYLQGDPSLEARVRANRQRFSDVILQDQPGSLEQMNEQLELDRKILSVRPLLQKSPIMRFGFSTDQPRLWNLLVHPFYYQGLFHLITHLCFFFFLAPFLEDRWGRIFFPIFFLGSAILASLLYLVFPGNSTILYGAGAPIAAVAGAFAVRFHDQRFTLPGMPFFYGYSSPRTIPVGVIIPFYIATIFVYGLLMSPFLTWFAQAAWTMLWGFVIGGVTAIVIARFNLELRLYSSEYDSLPQDVRWKSEVEDMLRHNQKPEAFELLKKAVEQYPEDEEFLELFWDQGVRQGRQAQTFDAGLELFSRSLARQDFERAYFTWLEMNRALPEFCLTISDAVVLTEGLLHQDNQDQALNLLENTACRQNKSSSSDPLFQLLDEILPLNGPLTLRLLTEILRWEGIAPQDEQALRARHCQLVKKFPLSGDELNPGFIEIHREPLDIPGQVEPLEDPFSPTRMTRIRVEDGRVQKILDQGLEILVTGRHQILGFQRIKAVSGAVIRELGSEPYLLIDLILKDPMQVFPIHPILRLDSRLTDLKILAPTARGSLEAARSFIENLLLAAATEPLPDREALLAKGFPEFTSIFDFESQVYGASSAR